MVYGIFCYGGVYCGPIAFNGGIHRVRVSMAVINGRQFDQCCAICGKRREIGCQLALFSSKKSHTGFRLVPKSMNINDLERRSDRRPALSLR